MLYVCIYIYIYICIYIYIYIYTKDTILINSLSRLEEAHAQIRLASASGWQRGACSSDGGVKNGGRDTGLWMPLISLLAGPNRQRSGLDATGQPARGLTLWNHDSPLDKTGARGLTLCPHRSLRFNEQIHVQSLAFADSGCSATPSPRDLSLVARPLM